MKISVRDALKGEVVGVEKGRTVAHVRIEIGNDKVIAASSAKQAVDEPGIEDRPGGPAVIAVPEVMVAVD